MAAPPTTGVCAIVALIVVASRVQEGAVYLYRHVVNTGWRATTNKLDNTLHLPSGPAFPFLLSLVKKLSNTRGKAYRLVTPVVNGHS